MANVKAPTTPVDGTGMVYPTEDELRALPVGKLADAQREANAYMALVSSVINSRAGETE